MKEKNPQKKKTKKINLVAYLTRMLLHTFFFVLNCVCPVIEIQYEELSEKKIENKSSMHFKLFLLKVLHLWVGKGCRNKTDYNKLYIFHVSIPYMCIFWWMQIQFLPFIRLPFSCAMIMMLWSTTLGIIHLLCS